MDIGLISPAFPSPQGGLYVGIETHAVELARHLIKRGHSVTVFTTFWNGGSAVDQFEGISVYRSADLSGTLGRYAVLFDLHFHTWGRKLLDYAEILSGFDVLHALAPLSSTKQLVDKGMPLITHFYHFEEIRRPVELLFKPFHYRIERVAYRDSALVMTPSESSSQDLQHRFHISPMKVRVVPLGVDPAKFSSQRVTGTRDSIRILFVGEHEPRKGIKYLLEAVHLLRNSGVDAKLATIGQGSALRKLRDFSYQLGVSGAVEFGGYIQDPNGTRLPEAYREADIFVLPSLREGFGFVLLEAMASGMPIVASNVSAIPEVVGDAGILVPPRDSEALAGALQLLAEDPAMRVELGERGRNRVRRHYSWDKVMPQVIGIYEEAIDRAGPKG